VPLTAALARVRSHLFANAQTRARSWPHTDICGELCGRGGVSKMLIRGTWAKDQEVTIDNGKVMAYVVLKVTFILSD
jgi:hypothetical protein